MKRFLLKLVVLCGILAVYFTAFFCLEPYNYLFEHTSLPDEDAPITFMRAFSRAPSDCIILGDSRMRNVTQEEIQNATDKPYFNLSFGGASVDECVDMFWYAAGVTQLRDVVFQVSFYNLNADYIRDRMAEEIKQADDALLFMRSFDKHQSTWTRAGKLLRGTLTKKEKTKATQEALVAYAQTVDQVCKNYALNQPALDDLCEIADYCAQNGIALRFVAPPVHRTVWEKVVLGRELTDELQSYKQTLAEHATVVDMESPCQMTDSDEYSDGFHMLGALRQAFVDRALN